MVKNSHGLHGSATRARMRAQGKTGSDAGINQHIILNGKFYLDLAIRTIGSPLVARPGAIERGELKRREWNQSRKAEPLRKG